MDRRWSRIREKLPLSVQAPELIRGANLRDVRSFVSLPAGLRRNALAALVGRKAQHRHGSGHYTGAMEFTVAGAAFPMPVGRVEYLHKGRTTFTEFLRGIGKNRLTDETEGLEWPSGGGGRRPDS